MDKFKDYSQNGEQKIILENVLDTGTFLSLGENNGECLSNVRDLALKGWGGVCVEPSKLPFQELEKLYKDNPNVHCENIAIGLEDGEFAFYDSGSHAGIEGTGLLSSLDKSQIDKWGKYTTFTETKVKVKTFASFLEGSPIKKFDFVSIDCENMDYEILSQMNLDELGVKCLIVESNSIANERYVFYCGQFGFKIIHRNAENLIFKK